MTVAAFDTHVSPRPPFSRGLPVVGVLPAIRRDPLSLFSDSHRLHGDVVGLKLGLQSAILLRHPNHVKYVLVDQRENFRKCDRVEALKPLLGNGLLTSEGEGWARRRKLLQPVFSRSRVLGLTPEIDNVVRECFERFDDIAASGDTVDFADEMSRIALRVIVRTMFGASIGPAEDTVGTCIKHLQEHANDMMWSLTGIGPKLPTARNRRFNHSLQVLNRIADQFIETRREQGGGQIGAHGSDLLGLLLDASMSDDGPQLSDRQIRDEVLTIFAAGHETTGCALAWYWHLTSRDQAIDAPLADEARDAVTDDGVDLEALEWTEMCLNESMRLLPSIWWFGRQANQPDDIGGMTIKRDETVIICPYTLHRHPDFWPDADTFDPYRFAAGQKRDRFAFLPFGAGPHVCVGTAFAMVEMKIITAMLRSRYKVEMVGPPPELVPLITLRPEVGSLKARLSIRH